MKKDKEGKKKHRKMHKIPVGRNWNLQNSAENKLQIFNQPF